MRPKLSTRIGRARKREREEAALGAAMPRFWMHYLDFKNSQISLRHRYFGLKKKIKTMKMRLRRRISQDASVSCSLSVFTCCACIMLKNGRQKNIRKDCNKLLLLLLLLLTRKQKAFVITWWQLNAASGSCTEHARYLMMATNPWKRRQKTCDGNLSVVHYDPFLVTLDGQSTDG